MYRFLKHRLALLLILTLVAGGASGVQAYELGDRRDGTHGESSTSLAPPTLSMLAPRSQVIDTSAGNSMWSIPSSETTDLESWVPQKGDIFEVNVQTNIGHLYHPDGSTLEFEVVTGVRRVVRYIGLRYFAATPAAEWIAQDMQIKKNRMTFGKSGRFIRLYKNGTDATAYGVHGFGRENSMFKVPDRYGSMGCIIVREEVMDILQKTLELNDGKLPVRTFPDLPQEK